MLSVIIGALIAGTVLGILGRLLLKGKQDIPWWATIGAGIVAAFVGGAVANWLGVGNTNGIDWIRHLIQVIFAVIAVWATARIMGGKGKRT
ncbi:MAG: GlsB/YeaQ/YmgE family stress response membrane protein, partial [Mycobacteriales bacterium]